MKEPEVKLDYQDWHHRHIPMWQEHLAPLLDGRCVRALEIGSFEGRSALWLLENMLTHPSSTLTCVDTWDGEDAMLKEQTLLAEHNFDFNVRRYASKVRKIKESSDTALARLLPFPTKFSFIYVDGSHEGFDALTDLLLSWRLLHPGGYLVADDMRWKSQEVKVPPIEAWNAFVSMQPPGFEQLHLFRQGIARKMQ